MEWNVLRRGVRNPNTNSWVKESEFAHSFKFMTNAGGFDFDWLIAVSHKLCLISTDLKGHGHTSTPFQYKLAARLASPFQIQPVHR